MSTSEAVMSYFGPIHCPSKIGTNREISFSKPHHQAGSIGTNCVLVVTETPAR